MDIDESSDGCNLRSFLVFARTRKSRARRLVARASLISRAEKPR